MFIYRFKKLLREVKYDESRNFFEHQGDRNHGWANQDKIASLFNLIVIVQYKKDLKAM